MHTEHHRQQINGLLITGAVLIVGGLLLFIFSSNEAVTVVPVPLPEPVAVQAGTIYTNPEYGITLRYGDEFMVAPATDVGVWRYNSGRPGTRLFSINLPRGFQPNTNFSNADISLGVSTDPEAVKTCLTTDNGDIFKGQDKGFDIFSLLGAGAGNIYETVSYRMVKNGACVALETLVHSTNIANYPPEFGTKEFDRILVQQKLDEVINSVTVQ